MRLKCREGKGVPVSTDVTEPKRMPSSGHLLKDRANAITSQGGNVCSPQLWQHSIKCMTGLFYDHKTRMFITS